MESGMGKISIIVPVYNVELYLPQCIESLIKQSYPNLEILLVDDGSTDNSGKICDEYALKDSRIRVFHQSNAGAASAKNVGLDHATGDYIAFIDSDDYVELNWIETLVSAAEKHQADIVEYDFDKIFTGRSELVNHYPDRHKLFSSEEYLAQYLFNWTCSLFWNKLFKTSLIGDIRFRKERRCIDDEFFTYKVISNAEKIVRINDVLYHYRQRASSAVSSLKNRRQITDDSLEILIERYQWIKERFPKLTKTYLKHDIDIMFYFARDFDFTKDTVQKFQRTARFYLLQSIRHYPGRVTLLYILRLQGYSKRKLLREKQVNRLPNSEELFQ